MNVAARLRTSTQELEQNNAKGKRLKLFDEQRIDINIKKYEPWWLRVTEVIGRGWDEVF